MLEDATRAMWQQMAGGKRGIEASVQAIGESSETRARFSQAFGGAAPSKASVVQALAAFQRTLVCGRSAYDRFASGEAGALNEQQVLGWELFSGKAGCTDCHAPPYFSDALGPGAEGFHNTGLGRLDRDRPDSDGGRARVTKKDDDWGAFKTPTLRGAAGTAPFFHDGSLGVLDGAVILMARGGRDNPHRSPKLRDAKLELHEIQSIIDFLPALDCTQVVSSGP
jgi:cytochrome c peroxidase